MAKIEQGGFIIDVHKPAKPGKVARLVIHTKAKGATNTERWVRDIGRDKAMELAIKLLLKCR